MLIAGGDPDLNSSTLASASAEVWSSASGGMFTATGSMNVARQVFTLTTLPNGQVLAVGGSPSVGSGAGSATAELYNPATDMWTLTGSMPSGRLGQTATLLPDGRVLIVGDAPTAATYNYETGTFSTAGSEGSFQRSYQTATLLANGDVLIAGGVDLGNTPLATASVYDPTTGTFTPTANDMSTPHSQGFAALLPDGEVIVGGGFSSTSPLTTTTAVDIYNPATNCWSSGAPLLSPPDPDAFSAEAQTLSDGQVVVMGIGPSGFNLSAPSISKAGVLTFHLNAPAAGKFTASATTILPTRSSAHAAKGRHKPKPRRTTTGARLSRRSTPGPVKLVKPKPRRARSASPGAFGAPGQRSRTCAVAICPSS